MKQTILGFTGKQLCAAIILITTFAIATPIQTKANTVNREPRADSTKTSMQYLGSTEDGLLFDLKIVNPGKSKFTLFIQDEEGNVLYSNNYDQTNFSKKFKVLKDDNISRYNFIINSRDKNLAQTFTVTSTEKRVRDIEITKL